MCLFFCSCLIPIYVSLIANGSKIAEDLIIEIFKPLRTPYFRDDSFFSICFRNHGRFLTFAIQISTKIPSLVEFPIPIWLHRYDLQVRRWFFSASVEGKGFNTAAINRGHGNQRRWCLAFWSAEGGKLENTFPVRNCFFSFLFEIDLPFGTSYPILKTGTAYDSLQFVFETDIDHLQGWFQSFSFMIPFLFSRLFSCISGSMRGGIVAKTAPNHWFSMELLVALYGSR